MASGPITSWQLERGKVETVTDFIYLGSKITADGDCNHEIRRWLLFGGKAMYGKPRQLWQTSVLKKRHHFANKGPYSQFSSVQSLSCVWLFATPWTVACQASLSITNSQSFFKLMSIKSVMSSNHLIFCCPFLLLLSTFSSIRVFSSESVLRIRWPKCWSFSFSISPSNELFRTDFL